MFLKYYQQVLSAMTKCKIHKYNLRMDKLMNMILVLLMMINNNELSLCVHSKIHNLLTSTRSQFGLGHMQGLTGLFTGLFKVKGNNKVDGKVLRVPATLV